MGYLRNLRELLAALERLDLLVRVRQPINKDTEMHPLVRLQFRGLPPHQRRGFLFEFVTDSRGRTFDIPVAVGVVASSPQIYAAGMQCTNPPEVMERWQRAAAHPIPPERVESAPVQDVVWQGSQLQGIGSGLDALPIPISTPGFDAAPYITAGHWHTKDPQTRVRNVGNYRGMLKAPDRTGVYVAGSQHIGIHWEKCRRSGIPLEAAIVVGVPPVVSFCAVSKLGYGVDELAVAGGMAGEPIPVVRCRTIDMEVPAEAEFVIEGQIRTDILEPEAPFGEYHGYMAGVVMNPVFEVSAITMRRNPIWVSFLSQYPPSESSQIRQIPNERLFLKFLRDDGNNPAVKDVVFPQYAGSMEMAVVVLAPTHPSQVWKALNAAVALEASYGKIVIAIDEDVDARDPEALWWAVNYHCQPHRDIRITRGKVGLATFSVGPDVDESMFTATYPDFQGVSAMLIDATRKWAYPPVSLPRHDIMEGAVEKWRTLGLPELNLRSPWFSAPTAKWTEEARAAAELALNGEYLKTGELRSAQRVPSGQPLGRPTA